MGQAAGSEGAGLRIVLGMSHLSRRSGGLSESVPLLADALRAAGADARIVGVADGPEADMGAFAGARTLALPPLGPRAFGAARGFAAALDRLAPDVIDTQHLWMHPSLAALGRHRRAGTPLVITPRGMLDPWAVARSRLKKRLVRLLFEDAHLAAARCLRALNPREAEGFRAFGYRGPVVVVPNAVALPDAAAPLPAGGPRVLLFLGRIDPKKGIAELVEAWARCAAGGATAGWRLQITGEGSAGYREQVAARVPRALLDSGEVAFTGDLRGPAKAAAFRGASAFVLPSYSEGLPMSVLEAWSHGRAVLTTEASNLPEGFAAGAAIRIETDPEALAASLHALFRTAPADLAAMGARGRALAEARFSAGSMARDMLRVYRWAAGQGPAPDDLMAG